MSTETANTSEFGAYYRLFEMTYGELFELLAGLPDEALSWKPFEISPWQGECAPLG